MQFNVEEFKIIAQGMENRGGSAFSSTVNGQRREIQEFIMNKYDCNRKTADYLLGRATQSSEVMVKIMGQIEKLDINNEIY